MTAPVLAHKKFYIIKPATGRNYLYKPTFAEPDGAKWWTAVGSVTIEVTGEEQRFGAYSMQVNPVTGADSFITYGNLSVTNGSYYTFSCYIKGVAGQSMSLIIATDAGAYKATTTFTATGYWQREEVTHLAAETATYRVYIKRASVASTAPFYVDGVQFEPTSVATTLMEGYMAGCRWEGIANDSTTYRTGESGFGGEIVDLSDYCEIVQVTGLGHGDWNQILTKMTSGGDMYQTHIRKSRNFSIIVDFTGNSLSEIETNRKAVIDLIRPDLLTGQEMIVRYQGVDVNGDEATNPVDIVCVPLPATLVDTPDLPTYQRAVLNFTVPSGLLNGAYNEGKELDLYADFPAEYIVKRDKDGNWCTWDGSSYENLMEGQGTDNGLNGDVLCMAEGPDGKIYVGGNFTNAGGDVNADYLARWNPVSEEWESVGSTGKPSRTVTALIFDAAGDLIVGETGFVKKYTLTTGAPAAWADEDGGGLISLFVSINKFVISPNGYIYAVGFFIDGVGDSYGIAYCQYTYSGLVWQPFPLSEISGGEKFNDIALAPNGDIIVGGKFTSLDGVSGATNIASFDGITVKALSALNGEVHAVTFGATGYLYAGGDFTNAGGIANADYIAKWSGSKWESLGSGTNNVVYEIAVNSGKVYVSGLFTIAGGLTLTDRVAVWSNGAWQPFDIDLPGTGVVYSILPASDGSLYIGGAFSTTLASENAETGIVALNLNVSSASANTYPFMQVRGPGTLKAITNYSTGKTIAFDGLTLNAGEYINLFFDPLNLIFQGGWSGRGNLMRYVVPGSDYGDFYLMPGDNLISLFFPDSDENLGSGAFISWTPLFWGIDGALL